MKSLWQRLGPLRSTEATLKSWLGIGASETADDPTAAERPRSLRRSLARIKVGMTCEGGVLRLVALDRTTIVFWDAVPFDARLMSGPLVLDAAELGKFIRDALRRRSIPASAVYCAIAGIGSIGRVFELRYRGRPPAEVPVGEAARALGVSPARYDFHTAVLEATDVGLSCFAVAIPRDAPRGLLQALEYARIKPRVLDLRALAMARAIGQMDGICVHADEAAIDVAIVLSDIPHVVHSQAVEPQVVPDEIIESAIVVVREQLVGFDEMYPGVRIPGHVPVFVGGPALAGLKAGERVRRALGRPVGSPTPYCAYPPEFPIGSYLAQVGAVARGE